MYITGAPYLDEDKCDNMQMTNKKPIFLSENLLSSLQRHLLWRLDYKMDVEKNIGFERIRQYFKIK